MDVKRVRLIGIKCRNLKANKWDQTERQIVGYLFGVQMDVNSLWVRRLICIPLS